MVKTSDGEFIEMQSPVALKERSVPPVATIAALQERSVAPAAMGRATRCRRWCREIYLFYLRKTSVGGKYYLDIGHFGNVSTSKDKILEIIDCIYICIYLYLYLPYMYIYMNT